jgi:hypothetical protein
MRPSQQPTSSKIFRESQWRRNLRRLEAIVQHLL